MQALALDWTIGTLVWIYWTQGLILVLLGLLRNRQRFLWVVLLGIMLFYCTALLGLTFPLEGASYIINGKQVNALEFTVLHDTQWSLVFVNCGLLLTGYLLAYAVRHEARDSMYGSGQVIKRLVPLHLIIFLAILLDWSVIFFLCLKFIADILAEPLTEIVDAVVVAVKKQT